MGKPRPSRSTVGGSSSAPGESAWPGVIGLKPKAHRLSALLSPEEKRCACHSGLNGESYVRRQSPTVTVLGGIYWPERYRVGVATLIR